MVGRDGGDRRDKAGEMVGDSVGPLVLGHLIQPIVAHRTDAQFYFLGVDDLVTHP